MLCDFSLIRRINVGICALNTQKYKEENMHCFIDLSSVKFRYRKQLLNM